jgi:hypothetical protein
VDLAGVSGEVRFIANLRVIDQSSGFEATDSFKAELIIDGNAANPVNLIAPHDTNGDGILTGGAAAADDEFNADKTQDGNYVSNFQLAHLLPAGAASVQLVISGVNDSPTEIIVLENVLLTNDITAVDSDNDDITDVYEDANGLDKNNAADRNLDPDGDGQSNYQEFLAGNDVILTWSSVPGKIYRIELSPDLAGWLDAGLDFAAAAAPGTETTFSINIPAGFPPGYFLRVKVK